MRAQQERRSRRERAFEVCEVHAIGRTDLDERGAAALQDVGNAKPAADLDELVARDDHLAAFGQRIEHEQHGGRAVVDDQRIFGAGGFT